VLVVPGRGAIDVSPGTRRQRSQRKAVQRAKYWLESTIEPMDMAVVVVVGLDRNGWKIVVWLAICGEFQHFII
jgi:hypothetical protein